MKLILSILILSFFSLYAQETGTITGRITDKANNEGLPGVNIVLKGTYYGAATDFDGNFRIKSINPGTYNIEVSLIGYKTVKFGAINVERAKMTELNVELEESALTLGQEVIIFGTGPMLDAEETQSKRTISKEDIQAARFENISDIVVQQAGVVKSDNEIHIRGGRSNENAFLLDGISVQDPLAGTGFGLQLSANAIEEVEVITGGFNAEFGQATSGVVNVRTREGSDRYNGSVSYKRDNFGNLDSYNVFNIDVFETNLSGPEPLASFILPAIGLRIPGELSFFTTFYMGLSDGITQGYFKPTANQLYSSTFRGKEFAPRADNRWFWLL